MPKTGKYAQLRYQIASEKFTFPIFNYGLNEDNNYQVNYWSVGNNTPIRRQGMATGALTFQGAGCQPDLYLLNQKSILANLYYSNTEPVDYIYISPNQITLNWIYEATNFASQYWDADYVYVLNGSHPFAIPTIETREEDSPFCLAKGCELQLKIDDVNMPSRQSASLRLVYNKFNAFWNGTYFRQDDLGVQDFVLDVRVNDDFDIWKSLINTDVIFKIYVNDVDYWELKWMKGMSISNIIVSPRTNEIRSMTISFGYNKMMKDDDDQTLLGYIKLPGGASLV